MHQPGTHRPPSATVPDTHRHARHGTEPHRASQVPTATGPAGHLPPHPSPHRVLQIHRVVDSYGLDDDQVAASNDAAAEGNSVGPIRHGVSEGER